MEELEKVAKMSAAEKMLAALKGSREMRMLLIRDKNRIVWSAVLASPKMTDADAEEIAQMWDVQPDVLRELAKNRQWMKQGELSVRLLMNPRTPEDVAMKLLGRLTTDDLARVGRDPRLPPNIRAHAESMRLRRR
jgi:hypothetical protein